MKKCVLGLEVRGRGTRLRHLDTVDCDMVESVVNLVQHLNSNRPETVDIMCQSKDTVNALLSK